MSEGVPEEATHYTVDPHSGVRTFWKIVPAFNMRLLEYYSSEGCWRMKFGLLPWDDLLPLTEKHE